MSRIKTYLEDDVFRARKAFKIYEKKEKSFKYGSLHYKNLPKRNSTFSTRKNTAVVIKITSSATNLDSLKKHLDYISRQGNLEVVTSDGKIYQGKENLSDLSDDFNKSIYKIPSADEIFTNSLKEKRETLNMVFSMKEHSNAPTTKIREAAIQTIKKKYPNNFFAIAMHNDTDNPHCHLCLKIVDDFGKRINPKKRDLDELRKEFALELNRLGVEATTKIYHNYDKNTGLEINNNIYAKADFTSEKRHKAHHYQVIGFGAAHYKFDMNQDMSYYVRYRTSKGVDKEIWSADLERVIKDNDVKVGEYCRFVITGEQELQKNITNKKTGEQYTKTVYKKEWDVSVEGRLEKILNPLKKKTKAKFEVTGKNENIVAQAEPVNKENRTKDEKIKENEIIKERESGDREI